MMKVRVGVKQEGPPGCSGEPSNRLGEHKLYILLVYGISDLDGGGDFQFAGTNGSDNAGR